MATETEIRIRAEVLPHNRDQCRFTVDRPVFPNGFIRVGEKDKAAGVPLAEKLLAVDGIAAVEIGENQITVTRPGTDNWPVVGKAVGQAIRAQIQSGEPAVSAEAAARVSSSDSLRARVQAILDHQINPAVASHGGRISLLDVQGNRIYIKMGGGCQGCSAADTTLRDGVERTLREQIDQPIEIFDTTDHAGGTNPYYTR